MIVERNTYPGKIDSEQGAADLMEKVMKLVGPWEAYRIYMPNIGPLNAVCLEVEFSDFDQRREWWANLNARSELAEWVKEWHALRMPGGTREIWTLVK